MSILKTEPAESANTYEKDALIYEFANEYGVTAIADSSGFYKATVLGISLGFSVGDVIYLGYLIGKPFTTTPFCTITTVTETGGTHTEITTDATYQGTTGSLDYIRTTEEVSFEIYTGYTTGGAGLADQPRRLSGTIKVSPDFKDGILRFNVAEYVKSRFVFGAPNVGTSYDSVVQYYAQEVGELGEDTRYGRKAISGTDVKRGYFYQNRETVYSTYSTGSFTNTEYLISDFTVLENASIAAIVPRGAEFTINFQTGLPDTDTSTSPSIPSTWSFLTNSDGTVLTGLTGVVPLSGSAVNHVVTWDNGIDDPIAYTLNFTYLEAIDTLTACEGTMLCWWDREGGWQFYNFEGRKVESIIGGKDILAKGSDGVRVIAKKDHYTQYTLNTKPLSSTTLDFLKGLLFANQIFIVSYASDNTISSYTKCYSVDANRDFKTTPYKAIDQEFSIEVIVSDEIITTDEY